MEYDIIFVTGEIFFDHPLCGVAILKRLLEKKGYNVGIIEKPICENDILTLSYILCLDIFYHSTVQVSNKRIKKWLFMFFMF